MSQERIKKVMQYPEIYQELKAGTRSMDDVLGMVRTLGYGGGDYKRRKEFLEGSPPYIEKSGEKLTFKPEKLRSDLYDMIREFCKDDDLARLDTLNKRITELEDIVTEQEGLITELRDKVSVLETEGIKKEMDKKVFVASSLEVGPKRDEMDGLFLDDPQNLLDVEKLVSVYGGQLDSFYKEIPTDEEPKITEDMKKRYDSKCADQYVPMTEPGKELTLDNYRSRIMKRLGTERFFKKRLGDVEKTKDFEKKHGKLMPDNTELMYNPEDDPMPRMQQLNEILKNRFETLNRIIESDEFTNQEKLMLFAVNGNFRYRDMEQYLKLASRYCINGNFLIYLLQGTNPNVCDNYINMKAFLQQFISPSEFRMKLDLARELIEGKWYITANYGGKMTKFQLVPIDEFNELRQKVGLPVSEFHYKEDDAAGSDQGNGMETPDDEMKEASELADHDSFDLPNDGFDLDFYDDDLPF